MNKELEALEKFLDDYLTLCEKLHTNRQEKMLLDKNSPYNVLKTYLQFINNANPSEALKELEGIEYVADVLKVNHKIGSRDIANQEIKEMVDRLNYRIPTIKQALIKYEKEHKALEIIKPYLRLSGNWLQTKVNIFNIDNLWEYVKEITDEEQLNLLKEVLE